MSDLISRSALLQEFEKYNKMQDRDLWHITGIKAFIENQPIAYDVDKVVKELEEKKHNFSGGSLQTIYYWKGIEEAIEIVKGGGVNE